MAGDRERCLDAGMDGYLVKPIRPAMLVEAVERAGARGPAAPLPPADAPGAVLDRAALLERVDGDTQLLREISDMLARECGRLLTRVREAIACGDGAEFSRGAHSLRGMFRTLAATAAQDVAQALERIDPVADGELAESTCAMLEHEVSALKAALAGMLEETVA